MEVLRTCVLPALMVVASVSAAPTPNVTLTTYDTVFGNATVAAEPHGRGTFGVLLSCTATFAFCVWTAVHPDVVTNVTPFYRVYYKAIWMLVAIIVPEGTILCSFGQWRQARKLHKEWLKHNPRTLPRKPKALFRRSSPQDTSDDRKRWDGAFGMDVAFFVVMGGFVVVAESENASNITTTNPTPVEKSTSISNTISLQSSDNPQPNQEHGSYSTTLTPAGFLKYLYEGYIHDETFERASIADKGKSSIIGKLLASIQALWLIVLCISRWVSGLAITLLEVHVAIQVLCAIMMTVFWWNKPLDVNEPLKIVLKKKCSLDFIKPIPDGSTPQEEEGKTKQFPRREFITKRAPPNLIAITAKACYDIVMHVDTSIGVDPDIGNIGNDSRKINSSGGAEWMGMVMEGFLVSLIGSLHAAAWNSHFPTFVEGVLWKVSSVGMCVFPIAIVTITMFTGCQKDLIMEIWETHFDMACFFGFLLRAVSRIHRVWKKHTKYKITTEGGKIKMTERGSRSEKVFWGFAHCVMISCCFIFLAGYVASISFITVESYISMRSPADEAFLTPVWSEYWPHL